MPNNLTFLKKVRQVELVSNKLVANLLAGNYRSIFRGLGIEFDEVREYVIGDDARLIDWNVTSRMGSPFTKTYREERELNLCLIVDISASLAYGSGQTSLSEKALIIYAVIALSAIKNNDMVSSLFFTDRIERWIKPNKGKKHVLRLLNDLIGCQPAGKGSNLGLALRAVSESFKRKGICVIISDFKTTNYFRELSYLARKHDVIAIRLFDPIDYELPALGTVMEVEDPEQKQTLLLDTISKKFRRNYQEYWETERVNWLAACRRRGVDTLEIGLHEDPGYKLMQFFKKKKKNKV
jgi:uncharacterized protein (DUF58 family)